MRYAFDALLSKKMLQDLTDFLHDATGTPTAIIDLEGNVLAGCEWQDICTHFHRIHPEACAQCVENNTIVTNQLVKGAPYAIYKCKNGLVDAAVPITIEDEHIANLFAGKFLPDSADTAEFCEQARRRFGFDENKCLEVLARVPVIPQEKIEVNLRMLSRFAVMLAEIGLKQAKLQEASVEVNRKNRLLQAINTIFSESLACETDKAVAETCLRVAEEVTGSKFGFIGEINKAGRFDTTAMSDPGWNTCRLDKTDAVKLINDMELRGIWGKVLLDGSPLITNDPDSHPDSVGTPADHPAITSFLGLPLHHADRVIGMIALANKESDYSQAELDDIEILSVAFVEALIRKRTEIALEQHQKHLQSMVEEKAAELIQSYKDLQAEVRERKQAQEELKARNEELEQFAYVASHDLQEPLRMVASYTQLLANRYKDKLDEDANDFITFAVDGAGRMKTLINDLLEYSRVGTRGKPFRPTDCGSAAADAVENLKISIEETHAQVQCDRLPTVMADRTQLVQLFQNLIGNAVKFHCDEPPCVHISTRQVTDIWGSAQASANNRLESGGTDLNIDTVTDQTEMEAEQKHENNHESPITTHGNFWLFSVKDNGIGIAPEFRERIFIIFQRLHGKSTYSGTGIGLAICKKIVERHGGRIWVESQRGKGSTFCFTLPCGGD